MDSVEVAEGDALAEELVITLAKPIPWGRDGAVSELALREPTVGELRKADKAGGTLDVNVMLVALVAGVAPALIDKLGARDLNKAVAYLKPFVEVEKAAEAPEMAEELVLTLRKPVINGKKQLEELRLREPTAGEMKKAEKAARAIDSNAQLVALVAGVELSAIDQIGARDLKRAMAYLMPFIASDQ